jgi:hemerythrin
MSDHFRAAVEAGQGTRVYGLMLESLTDYAHGHFRLEEACMEQYRCPAAGANCAAHEKFMEALAHFQGRFAAAGYDAADALRLVNFIDNWLTQHILRIDTSLKACVERTDAS